MKKLSLTLHPRVILVSRLARLQNLNLESLSKVLDIIKVISVTEEEKSRVRMREEKAEGGQVLTRWDVDDKESGEKLDVEKEFELSDDLATELERVLESIGDEENLSLQDRPLLEVYEQLKKG